MKGLVSRVCRKELKEGWEEGERGGADKLILRVEDTDANRSKPQMEKALFEDLRSETTWSRV